jgi:hypothetical protein
MPDVALTKKHTVLIGVAVALAAGFAAGFAYSLLRPRP